MVAARGLGTIAEFGDQPRELSRGFLDRGLALVAALADRWGLSVEGGSTVWFELDCDGYGDPLNFTAKLSRLSDAHAASVD